MKEMKGTMQEGKLREMLRIYVTKLTTEALVDNGGKNWRSATQRISNIGVTRFIWHELRVLWDTRCLVDRKRLLDNMRYRDAPLKTEQH